MNGCFFPWLYQGEKRLRKDDSFVTYIDVAGCGCIAGTECALYLESGFLASMATDLSTE